MQGGFHVRLDGRVLRTPARGALLLPSLPLALAVAAEWEWQDARTLRPFTMPIMARLHALCLSRTCSVLCCTL